MKGFGLGHQFTGQKWPIAKLKQPITFAEAKQKLTQLVFHERQFFEIAFVIIFIMLKAEMRENH